MLLPHQITENKQLSIYNSLGQQVFTKALNAGQQFYEIPVRNILANNVYFIEVEGMKKSTKIIWK